LGDEPPEEHAVISQNEEHIRIRAIFRREPEFSRFRGLAGSNNLLPRHPARYLYLRATGSEYRDGKWTCDMVFQPLQRLPAGDEGEDGLQDAVNWRAWLGDSYELVK
jgi:hypothetical protein